MNNAGFIDHRIINMDQEEEVQYWTKKYKISTDQLQEAIREAGSFSVIRVEEALVSLGYIQHVIT